ncbi:MAG: hypothetical protein IJS96_03275 [Schwartzia sp.]|nr:hypothetical protein [Schwartzia sp. (in: firmicutes)]
MFQGIGKIGDYVRQHNLHLMMNHKLATGETVDLNRSKPLAVSYVSSTDKSRQKSAADKRRVASIKQKLKNGEKLSASDMKFLKETDSGLYRTAKTVQEAREELERDLRRAKTKGEARLAVVRAMAKVSQEAQISQGAGGMGAGGGAGGAAGNMGDAMTAGGASAVGAGETAAAAGGGAAPGDAANANANDDANANVNDNANKAAIPDSAGNAAGEEKTIGNNDAGEGKTATASEKGAKSAPIMQNLAEAPDADDGGPLPPTQLLVIRALQNAWTKYVRSDEFKELPADEMEEARRVVSGKRRPSQRQRQMAAAIAYQDAALAAPVRQEKA